MKKVLFTYIVLILGATGLHAQIPDSLRSGGSSGLGPAVSDTTGGVALAGEPEEKVIKRVPIWKLSEDAFQNKITNDSLLRWQIWPNWGDFYGYRRDALTFRRGTIGRLDAFTIRGYDSYEQQLWLDEIAMNDPVTGLVNYNFIPHHKIGRMEESYTSTLNSDISTIDYYITQPVSYLNYDESTNDYRNLEFMIAQNTSPGTNIEISYWDRRDGGYYPNNQAEGSQIFGKLYHHIGKKYQLQAMILHNTFENEEPGGYQIGNPAFFSFDEFGSAPKSLNGERSLSRTDMKVGIYQRSDTTSGQSGGLILSRTGQEQNTKIFADTLSRNLKTYSLRAFKDLTLGNLTLDGDVRVSQNSGGDSTSITRDSWNVLHTQGGLKYRLVPGLTLKGEAGWISRSDDESGNELYAGLKYTGKKGFEAEAGVAAASRIPSIQSLYWLSENYRGNPGLMNEEVRSAYFSMSKNWERLSLGVLGRMKQTKNAVLLSSDSSFVNAGSYDVVNGSFFARFEGSAIEIESSATGEYTLDENFSPGLSAWAFRDTKLLIRNSFFYKRYAFDRAAFIKMGLRTVWSPFITESQFYNAELDYWQFNSAELGIPAYFRMDAEVSARVRGIMVVLRWENTLDGLGQAGYFEAAGYPMMPRRLLVGIRAQFRN